MRDDDPFGRRPAPPKPKIWHDGDKRPPFDLRAFGRATLHFARDGVTPLIVRTAEGLLNAARNIAAGVGRIPEEKLGRAARLVPSHLRVAAWSKNLATTFAYAAAAADTNARRGVDLVRRIEPPLWPDPTTAAARQAARPEAPPEPEPVILTEPPAMEGDPLSSIRGEMGNQPAQPRRFQPSGPVTPPAPPGPLATGVIQITGFLLGWILSIIALPYGLARSIWLYVRGQDLRKIGAED